MSNHPPFSLEPSQIYAFFPAELVESWFHRLFDEPEPGATPTPVTPSRQVNRLLGPLVVFFAVLRYALDGHRSLKHAFLQARSHFFPNRPPRNFSSGSLTPARHRLPLSVLEHAHRHLCTLNESLSFPSPLPGFTVLCADGTSFSTADTAKNEAAFSRPQTKRGKASFPMIRVALLMNAATHLFVAEQHGPFKKSESELFDDLLGRKDIEKVIEPGVLIEGDRGIYSYERVCRIVTLGAEVSFRIAKGIQVDPLAELPDGSYLAAVWQPQRRANFKNQEARLLKLKKLLPKRDVETLLDRAAQTRRELEQGDGERLPLFLIIRVVEYEILSKGGQSSDFRLFTTVLRTETLSACQLAEGYHSRWNEEVGIREMKWLRERFRHPYLPGKSPKTVEQDFMALLVVHSLIRTALAVAAKEHGSDPARLSPSGGERVLTKHIDLLPYIPETAKEQWEENLLNELARCKLAKLTGRVCPRAVKKKMSKFPTRTRCNKPSSTYPKHRLRCRRARVRVHRARRRQTQANSP